MRGFKLAILPLAVACAIANTALAESTDEDRIRRLEAIVEKQQEMIESLSDELKQLKAQQGRPVVVERLDAPAAEVAKAEPAVEEEPAQDVLAPLSLRVYGFAMADAIYDFKRVDPNWEDTTRVSTIPTRSGAFGDDGNFTFGVRQSRRPRCGWV